MIKNDSPNPDIKIVTPQFERTDGKKPKGAPANRDEFEKLRHATPSKLKELGLMLWSEDDDLWLFPAEWYEDIPEGLEVSNILGETFDFYHDETSRDKREGVLSYGIIREGDDAE